MIPTPKPGDTHLAGLHSLCLFRWYTHLPCPVCGLTRSFVAAAHGHFADAVTFHPLGILVWAGAVVAVVSLLPFMRLPRVSDETKTILALFAAGLFTLIWAARLLHVLPVPP